MAAIYIKCCGKFHEVIQFTTKGPIQYGAECSKCGRRVAAETPEDVGWKWEKMKASKPLNAGLAERLWKIGVKAAEAGGAHYMVKPDWKKLSREYRRGWFAVATEVRKIVKEVKEGE